MSLAASLIVVAMLAGGSFATERSDRSAEFLAGLPPSRTAALMSKLVIVLGTVFAWWLLNPAIVLKVGSWFSFEWAKTAAQGPVASNISAMGVAVLGVGWLASIIVTNPASALLLGLLAPFFVMAGVYGVTNSRVDFESGFFWTCLAVGPVAFAVGNTIFLRRADD